MFRSIHYSAKLPIQRGFSTSRACRKIIKFTNHDDFTKKVFVDNDNPVVVDFHADWYEPCRSLTNNLTFEIKQKQELGLAVVNVENNMDLVKTFNIQAVPALLGIKNGLVVRKLVGIVNQQAISDLIKNLSETKTKDDSKTSKPVEI